MKHYNREITDFFYEILCRFMLYEILETAGPLVEEGNNTLLVHMCFNSLRIFIDSMSCRARIDTLNRENSLSHSVLFPRLLG